MLYNSICLEGYTNGYKYNEQDINEKNNKIYRR